MAAVLAAWVSRLGPPSVVEVTQRPDPVPGPGEVLVAVGAAAVNFPDVLVIAGKYQVPAPVPFIPGSEFAGVVQAAGAGVPPQIVGRRVIGTTFTGAFAEQVAVPAEAVQPVPVGLDDVHAAAFAVAYRTAYHAIVTVGAARKGQTMVVLGAAGGVGLASIDVGVALGIRVLAAASSADRVALACSRGAAAGIDYSTEDLKHRIRELTGGQGADVVIDPVGGRYAEPALRALAWGGRFVCVGFAAGIIPCIPLNLVLLKGIIVRGLEMRTLSRHAAAAVADGDRRLDELVRHGLRPYVSSIRPLSQTAEALEEVAERRVRGKTVLIPAGPATPGEIVHPLGKSSRLGRGRWELEPAGEDRTKVTHTYDWSGVRDQNALSLYPRVSKEQMEDSLDRVATAVA